MGRPKAVRDNIVQPSGPARSDAHNESIRELRATIANVMVQLAEAELRLSCLARDLLVRTPPPPEKVDLAPLPTTEHQPELISVREALEELRISRTTFYKLKNRADFPQPVNFLPRRTLFRRSEIWAWLENRRR